MRDQSHTPRAPSSRGDPSSRGSPGDSADEDEEDATLEGLLLALSLHPEVLRKAHAELDEVVGPDRMPNFDDKDSLVYVNAIIKESLRWNPALPLSIPHATVADDEFRGYFIPAGTMLIPNTWYVDVTLTVVLDGRQNADHFSRACLHDPEVYEDPDVFQPERFIRDGKLDTSVRDPALFAFGYGRRHVALDDGFESSPSWHLLMRYHNPESAPDVTSPKLRCSSALLAHYTSSISSLPLEKMDVQ